MLKLSRFLLLLSILSVFAVCNAAAETGIILASTTSTENSGLFNHILPKFEKKSAIKVKVVARGTGAAIEMGRRGDADVVFVHAKEQELKAVQEGYFVNRHDVMYNDFVIIGPVKDPAKIKRIQSVTDAFKEISRIKHTFVSRGDKSGTHTKELAIWKSAGLDPKAEKWYLEAGQGMEKTQRIANEKQAYTLTDRGTWLATKDKDKLDLILVLEGDPLMFNQYGVMAVSPQKHKHVKHKEALQFIDWIISDEGQQAISAFKDSFGNSLFIANAR